MIFDKVVHKKFTCPNGKPLYYLGHIEKTRHADQKWDDFVAKWASSPLKQKNALTASRQETSMALVYRLRSKG